MTLLKRTLIALFVAAGAVLVVAAPASAAPPGSCANNSVCGYVNQLYSTAGGYEYVTGSAGSCQNVGLNDSWTSVFNNTGHQVRLYRDANCGNGVWTLANGDGLRNMSLYQPSWNDKISSVRMS